MAIYRFSKATGKAKKPKQSKSKQKVLTKLNSYLKQAEPETVEFLQHDLKATGNAVTYKELREAYLNGEITQWKLENWQHKYSKLVTGTLQPKWEQAAAEAAQEIKDKYPYFLYEPGTGAAAEWIKQHGAELVTNLAQDQIDALNGMIGYFSGNTAITPDEAARKMRACIGLTKPQAISNLRYQDAVKAAYLKQHPNAAQTTLNKKAKDAGARYAARQHRYRAQSIARTELAYGYNAGAYGATKDAQAQGYIGTCKKKWLTAFDERVCPTCSVMDEETVDMDATFSNGKMLPPGHPMCRCAVAYEEVDNANLTPQAATGAHSTQSQSQQTQQQPQAAQPAAQTQTPSLVQTTTTDPNAPQIAADVQTPAGMTYKGPANMGGTGEMYIYEDADGKQWLFKPAQDKGGKAPAEFRAYAQEAGYKVQNIVDPDTAVKVGTDTLDGKFGAFQERLNTLDEGGLKNWQKGNVPGWEDWDIKDTDVLEQLQREHTTDWLLGNYDSHGGNFITRIDGKTVGIDKEQAFKYISDAKSHKMSYTYHPNAKYGETEPIYNTMFRKYANGDIDLDLNESLQYIKRVEQIPDAEYREIFRDYAESLHGPGADAEKLLDAIVERKQNLRETYRAFYSELETERTGVKTVFKFSDEIAGTATPKPVTVKPKTPKKPKTTTKPKATTTPKTPVKTDGGYKISDVMDDMSILPNTQNGVAIHSDGSMVEGMNLRGRRITVNGVDKYEISGKLTEETWEAAAKNAKSRGMSRDMEFWMRNADGTYSTSNVGMKLDGFKIMDTNQSAFEIYADYVDKKQYSMGGYFRIRIDATGDAAKARKALSQILDKAGLKNVTADPTDAEELLLKKTRIAWQRDPKAMENCRYMTGTAREKEIDKILKSAGIDDNRVRNMELKEVFPGYSTYVDDAARMEYRKAGATHIWAGVDSEDSVVAICRSDGLTATNYRITGGMKKCGASPGADMRSGGADNVFVRLGMKNNEKYSMSYLGDDYRIIIDPDELNRTDWYAHEYDRYGISRTDDWQWKERPSSLQLIKDMKNSYSNSNELMFRNGISTDKFVGISCQSQAGKKRLMDAFKAQGITEYNGIPLDDFIQVTKEIGEDSMRGITGLSGYSAPF